MKVNKDDVLSLSVDEIATMGRDHFKAVMSQLLTIQAEDRKENAIYYYKPVSEKAKQIHLSTAQTLGIGGGNGSSKTEGCLAEIVTCTTGIIPESLRDDIDPRQKLRGPLNCRIVCESLTTVLHPIMLPKLQWWRWTGVDAPGGERGHWGWIPRDCLIDGDWNKSWSDKYRILKILYRDPFRDGQVTGESTIQFMSVDQDPSDFASGDYHIILHDEPPSDAIWRENEARTMRVAGRMLLAMTWPDDPAIAVDWLFDKVYEPATRANKHPHIDWINLFTTENQMLDQNAIALQSSKWSDEVRRVRLFGQPIRFSNRVHALFTDEPLTWCFPCGRTTMPVEGKCSHCQSATITDFCHVGDHEPHPGWPVIWLIDPHPRKPHMFAWWQVTPSDDLVQVMEGECDGDPTDVREMCDAIETKMDLRVTFRYIDPNMGRSPSSARRGITWQDEFSAAGLACDAPSWLDSEVGRKRIDEYLKPCENTLEPRIRISRRCEKTILQMKRYVWDDFKKSLEKDMKQRPKDKNDDFPTLMKYLLNTEPTFHLAAGGAPLIRRMKRDAPEIRRHALRF